jgi:hypothetical protein
MGCHCSIHPLKFRDANIQNVYYEPVYICENDVHGYLQPKFALICILSVSGYSFLLIIEVLLLKQYSFSDVFHNKSELAIQSCTVSFNFYVCASYILYSLYQQGNLSVEI